LGEPAGQTPNRQPRDRFGGPRLRSNASRPRRSILFAAVTAEEKGLLGAEYFTRYPTVPIESIVADLNLDMFLTLFPVKDVVAFGGEHSSLGSVVKEAADRQVISHRPPELRFIAGMLSLPGFSGTPSLPTWEAT